jgi:hypothetical protein
MLRVGERKINASGLASYTFSFYLATNFVLLARADSLKPICLNNCVVEAVIGPLLGLIFILAVCVLVVFLSRQVDYSESDLEFCKFSKRNPDRQMEDVALPPLSPMSLVEHADAENYQQTEFQSPESVPFSMIPGETPGGPLPPPIWPIRHVLYDGRPAPRDLNMDRRSPYSSTNNHIQDDSTFNDKANSMSMHHELLESFGIA